MVSGNVSKPKLRTLLHGFRELARRTVASDTCNSCFQGRRHRVVVRRRSHPQATGPNRDYIKSPILRPARCVHQHGLQAEFVLRCRGGGEGGYRSALGLGGGMERRIDVRDVSVGARESRRGYPRAIHPRDRRAERSPPRGFSSVGYVEIWAEGHSRSAGCGPSSTTCASSWADPSSSSCAYGGKGKDVRACA